MGQKVEYDPELFDVKQLLVKAKNKTPGEMCYPTMKNKIRYLEMVVIEQQERRHSSSHGFNKDKGEKTHGKE